LRSIIITHRMDILTQFSEFLALLEPKKESKILKSPLLSISMA